jgi:hypothetical protein
MIIWKGIGLGVAFLAALFMYLTKFIVPDGTSFKIQAGIGLVIAGLFWWLSMWRKGKQEENIMKSGDQEKIDKFLKYKDSNPMMGDLKDSSLFFIPVTYWHYIQVGGGLMILVSTLFK